MRWLKRLYDWVMSWSDTRYGPPALFAASVAEPSCLPMPPDFLLIAMCLGNREKWFRFAAICTVASVIGAGIGYAIGWGIWQSVDQFFFAYVPGFTHETFNSIQGYYGRWSFWIVFTAAFLPIPYKAITITAGVFGVNFILFIVAGAIGRAARFFLIAGLIHRYGEPIKQFIDRRFNQLAIAFAILLVAGFFVLNYVIA